MYFIVFVMLCVVYCFECACYFFFCIVVPLLPGTNPFAVSSSSSSSNNNNINILSFLFVKLAYKSHWKVQPSHV